MITARKRAFIEHYKLTRNAAESARLAGYSPKCSRQAGSRLLTNHDVKDALETWEAEERTKREQVKQERSRDSFIERAWADYESLPADSPIRPRYLELAGKALGYVGSGTNVRPNESLSITNICISGSESPTELWNLTRKLIGND